MPSPFSCGPVICECSRMETQIEKKYWNWQVFDLIHASGIWMRPKGSVSKFTCTNTVASLRALVKSNEVFQKDSPQAVLEKRWSEKFYKKFTQKELLLKSFLQLPHNLQLHWKRTAPQLFSYDFWKDFSEYCFVSEHWYSNRRNWSIRPHMF